MTRYHRLTTVDGVIAFDIDAELPSAGGTRCAPDGTDEEAALLARAMTYKFAPRDASPAAVLEAVGRTIEHLVDAVSSHADGPYAGAVAMAERFMAGWLPTEAMPIEAPVA